MIQCLNLLVLSSAVDGSQYIVGAFCYVSEAFDCVDFSVLIADLRFYEIVGAALSGLTYPIVVRVVVNSEIQSALQRVTTGVAQGSILGTLLFLKYSNTYPKS